MMGPHLGHSKPKEGDEEGLGGPHSQPGAPRTICGWCELINRSFFSLKLPLSLPFHSYRRSHASVTAMAIPFSAARPDKPVHIKVLST